MHACVCLACVCEHLRFLSRGSQPHTDTPLHRHRAHTRAHARTHTHTYMNIYIHTHARMSVCMHTYANRLRSNWQYKTLGFGMREAEQNKSVGADTMEAEGTRHIVVVVVRARGGLQTVILETHAAGPSLRLISCIHSHSFLFHSYEAFDHVTSTNPCRHAYV